jgi:hypothetical protein
VDTAEWIAVAFSSVSLLIAGLSFVHTRRESSRRARAELVASRGTTVDHGPLIDYDVTVMNAGPSAATNVRARLEVADGRVSAAVPVTPPVLMPGERGNVRFVGSRLNRPDDETAQLAAMLMDARVVLEWWDGRGGPHRQTSEVRLGL